MEDIRSLIRIRSSFVRVAQTVLTQQTYIGVVWPQSPAAAMSAEGIQERFDSEDVLDMPSPEIIFGEAVPYHPPSPNTVHFGRTEPHIDIPRATRAQGLLGGGEVTSPPPPPARYPAHMIPDTEIEIGIIAEVSPIFLSIVPN